MDKNKELEKIKEKYDRQLSVENLDEVSEATIAVNQEEQKDP